MKPGKASVRKTMTKCSEHTSLDFVLLIDHLVLLIPETLLPPMFRICHGQNQLHVVLALPIQSKHHFVAKSSYRFKAIIRKKNCKGSDLARWQIMSGQSGDRSFISDYFLTFYCDISLCSFTLKLLHVLSHVCSFVTFFMLCKCFFSLCLVHICMLFFLHLSFSNGHPAMY